MSVPVIDQSRDHHIYIRCVNEFVKDTRAVYGLLTSPHEDKRQNLKDMLHYLGEYLDTTAQIIDEGDQFYRALRSYVNFLNKQVNPQNRLERFFYKRVPDNQLVDVTKMTFGLIFRARCLNESGTDNATEREHESRLLDLSAGQTRALAKKTTQYNWARIAAGLALVVLGAGLIVGAGCVMGATYGAGSGFALAIGKFGSDLALVGASFVFAELMLVPIFRKCVAQNKAIDGSTKSIVAGLAGGMVAGTATAAATKMAHVLPQTVALHGGIIPIPAATTGVGVVSAITGVVSTAAVGFVALCRGVLFWHDAYVRREIHRTVETALNKRPQTITSP